MIPTLPRAPRNRLAALILAAIGDERARRELAALGDAGTPIGEWIAGGDTGARELVVARSRAAATALATLPVAGAHDSVASALDAAAALFDAGLFFEVHELLEPFWSQATGAEREALGGLVQVAVGYQHLANGNVAGAGSLLGDGSARLQGRRLGDLDLAPFARAVRGTLASVPTLGAADVPRFPRPPRSGATEGDDRAA